MQGVQNSEGRGKVRKLHQKQGKSPEKLSFWGLYYKLWKTSGNPSTFYNSGLRICFSIDLDLARAFDPNPIIL